MGEIGDGRCVEPMIIAASDGSAEMRTAVADAFKKFDRRTLERPLITAAQDPNAAVRKAASYLAAKSGQLKICSMLLSDQDETVRKQATLGLADLHPYDGEGILGAAFAALKDPSWKVRVAAIESLSRIGDRRAIDRLRDARDDSNHVVKQAIRRTLAKF